MFAELLLFIAILYTIQIGIFAFGAHKAPYQSDPLYRPTVSVIIAARNEEQNIRACLDSISRLTYPKELLEVVVVNDRSTDATELVIREFAQNFSFIKLHNAVEDPSGILKGKTNAVAQGADVTHGDIMLFTDADCIVPDRWIEETVKYYAEGNIGLVAGFTSLRARTTFEGIQALDWFILFSIAAATIRLHFPVTAVGNNLSVRRKAYDAVGGYRKIPFSVTEDYALFHAVMSLGTYKARFPVDRATLVQSLPCEDWKSLYHQKKRWFTGGADMDLKSIALFATGFLFKALLLVTLFLGGIVPMFLPLLLKFIVDLLLIRPALVTFGRLSLLWYFVPFEIYYIIYVVIFPPLVLLSRTVDWKERRFT
jgi:cellulose synthase/poly-beta-1,6-N-acetylglucosamine synthase-like glycosyltransferase